MIKILEQLTNSIKNIRTEENNLLKFVRSLNLTPEQKILDVGCGFGKKLALLRSHGFDVTGVEANQSIVSENINANMNCVSVSDFQQTTQMYDVVLMSHVIEHFRPSDLLEFMDGYLDRLKSGGHLIITTPLYSPYFYDDFDHIRPYQPTGIDMVFGTHSTQVQYYSRNKIQLVDIWFRKEFLKTVHLKARHLDNNSLAVSIIDLLSAVFFRLSLGVIARTDGWMGLYKKNSV